MMELPYPLWSVVYCEDGFPQDVQIFADQNSARNYAIETVNSLIDGVADRTVTMFGTKAPGCTAWEQDIYGGWDDMSTIVGDEVEVA